MLRELKGRIIGNDPTPREVIFDRFEDPDNQDLYCHIRYDTTNHWDFLFDFYTPIKVNIYNDSNHTNKDIKIYVGEGHREIIQKHIDSIK